MVKALFDQDIITIAALNGPACGGGGLGLDAVRMMKLVLRNGKRSDLRGQLKMEAVANGLTFQSDPFKARKAGYLATPNERRT